MMTRRGNPVPDVRVQAPMTPMIDIIFQLLIYFLLTMNMKEVEGKLLSRLPKDEGTEPWPALLSKEVRIRIRAENRGFHVSVDAHEIGRLERTPGHDVYRRAALRAAKVFTQTPAETVVLDADGTTPYEHIIGIFDACLGQNLRRLRFAAPPRR